MIEKEAEKINSAVLKYIIMFVVIISLAGVMFKIGEVEKWLDECEKKLDHNSKLTDMQTLVN